MLKIFTLNCHYSWILHHRTNFRENRTIHWRLMAKSDVSQYGTLSPLYYLYQFEFWSNLFYHSHYLIHCTKLHHSRSCLLRYAGITIFKLAAVRILDLG